MHFRSQGQVGNIVVWVSAQQRIAVGAGRVAGQAVIVTKADNWFRRRCSFKDEACTSGSRESEGLFDRES